MVNSQYLATAKVLIRVGREASSVDQFRSESAAAHVAPDQEVVNSELEIVTSRELASAIASEFAGRLSCDSSDAGTGDPGLETRRVANGFTAALVKNSYVMELTFQACSRQLAADILRRYVGLYQDRHIQAYAHPLPAFLGEQKTTLKARLAAIDAELEKYKINHDSFDPVQERAKLIETRLSLVATATQLRTHAADLRVRVEKLKQLLANTPQMLIAKDFQPSAGYNRGREQLMELKTKQSQYRPDSPAGRSIQSEVDHVEAALADEETQVVQHQTRNPQYDELSADLNRAYVDLQPTEAQLASSEDEIKRIGGRLGNLEKDQSEIERLQRDRSALDLNIKNYEQKEREALLMDELDKDKVANVTLIEPVAALPLRIWPRFSKFALFGAAGSIVAYFLLLCYVFVSHKTFIVPEAVERAVKLPVLVSLPRTTRG